jgi:hypothetical protein
VSSLRAESQNLRGSFKDLVVWQRAVELSLAVYKLTAFGSEEALQITEDLANQVGRMLVVMMRKLRS